MCICYAEQWILLLSHVADIIKSKYCCLKQIKLASFDSSIEYAIKGYWILFIFWFRDNFQFVFCNRTNFCSDSGKKCHSELATIACLQNPIASNYRLSHLPCATFLKNIHRYLIPCSDLMVDILWWLEFIYFWFYQILSILSLEEKKNRWFQFQKPTTDIKSLCKQINMRNYNHRLDGLNVINPCTFS